MQVKRGFSFECLDHGHFVAFREFRAFETIPPDLVRQSIFINVFEPCFYEIPGIIGKDKDLFNSKLLCLVQAPVYEFFSDASVPVVLKNSD